ncbi:MAG: sigma-54-dependent Fis family transcriptional regulator [Gemmatimonadota bacterium]|nr:MAG: sigma-54-dependent Fis family transcriptional regulator [Gemmatimonadota bacterium]
MRIDDEHYQQRLNLLNECGLVGKSGKLHEIAETILQVAPTNVTVLIIGESGTGKELIAQGIHKHSPRRFKPFIAVNCGALAEGVLESELFGHEKGAFTGAAARRKGVFELANGGTILLDEVGEMSFATQVKLLRVLEEKEFMRVGGTEYIQVDVRVIASTNKNLASAVEGGEFRRDLYYRLKVVEIQVPPLRARREDIPLFVDTFVTQFARENSIEFPGITEEAMQILINYAWPGNVRELKNLIESMVVLSPKRKIDADDIPLYLTGPEEPVRHLPVRLDKTPDQAEREVILRALWALKNEVSEMRDTILDKLDAHAIKEAPFVERDDGPLDVSSKEISFDVGTPMNDVEREMITRTLLEAKGNRRKAAKMLGMSERTFYRRLQKYDLS